MQAWAFPLHAYMQNTQMRTRATAHGARCRLSCVTMWWGPCWGSSLQHSANTRHGDRKSKRRRSVQGNRALLLCVQPARSCVP